MSEDWDGGMKTVAELRRERNLPIPNNKDSVYRPIHREERRFNPLKIPTSLQAKLPFASKPKLMKKKATKNKSSSLTVVHSTPEERKIFALVQQLNTLRKEKDKVRKDASKERSVKRLAEKQREQKKLKDMGKESKKRMFRLQGLKEQSNQGKRAKISDD